MIKYLLKITPERQYVQDLIDGKLYMNAAAYYHHIENGTTGQEDPMEAAVSSTSMMFINPLYPIYCMYQVEDSEIMGNKIHIKKSVVEGFGTKDGFIALIPYNLFVERLSTCDTNGHRLCHGSVHYGFINLSMTKKLFIESGIKQFFIKPKKFSEQNEYRIVVCEPLKRQFRNQILDGMNIKVETGFDHRIYVVPHGFADIMNLYKISKLHYDDNNYYIPVEA